MSEDHSLDPGDSQNQSEVEFMSSTSIPNPSRVVLHEVNSFLTLGDTLDTGNIITPTDVSLPALAEEVAVGQNHQVAELSRRQEFLRYLKAQYGKEKEKSSQVWYELKGVTRKMHSIEDQVDVKQELIRHLSQERKDLAIESNNLKGRQRIIKLEAARKRRLYVNYRSKMKTFMTKTDLFFEECSAVEEIKLLKTELILLKEETKELQGAISLRPIDSKEKLSSTKTVHLLLEEDKKLQEDINLITSQVHQEREKQKMLRKEIETLTRRNSVQFSRVQKHVQEEQLHLRKLNEEVFKLKQVAKLIPKD